MALNIHFLWILILVDEFLCEFCPSFNTTEGLFQTEFHCPSALLLQRSQDWYCCCCTPRGLRACCTMSERSIYRSYAKLTSLELLINKCWPVLLMAGVFAGIAVITPCIWSRRRSQPMATI